jgi:hypothetical protein
MTVIKILMKIAISTATRIDLRQALRSNVVTIRLAVGMIAIRCDRRDVFWMVAKAANRALTSVLETAR